MPPRGKNPRPPPPQKGGPARAPRLDATNLAGLTSLMNPQNVRPGADLEKAERAAMGCAAGEGRKKSPAADPVQLYAKELNDIAEELGIDLGGLDDLGGSDEEAPGGAAAPPPKRGAPPPNLLGRDPIDDLIGDLDLDSAGGSSGGGEDDEGSGGGSSGEGSSGEGSSGEGSSGEGSSGEGSSGEGSSEEGSSGKSGGGETPDDDSVLSGLGRGLGIDLDGARRHSRRRRRVPGAGAPAPGRPRLANLTEEQERRRHINSVMGDMRQETRTSFGVEHERVQDDKASKLEQIGQLRMTLEEEGVDCSGVGAPTMATPVEEIDSILAILKLKNDRNRYSSLAEEVILGLSEGIETVFDGSRAVPLLGWKPDYTGYHNTVNVKLHRMRYETSQVVGNVIERHRIGPTARIFMEILPSFFLYPRQRRKQRGSPGLHADPRAGGPGDARGAFSAIRRSDAAGDISSVADL